MTRDEIITTLENAICSVTFTKVDGTERTMNCTLLRDELPAATKTDPASQSKVREINPAVVVAWCVDRKQWRSFRVANVLKISTNA